MRFSILGKVRSLAVVASIATAIFTLLLVAGLGTASPTYAASSNCPSTNALASFHEATNVSASFSDNGGTRTYKFTSLTNEHPAHGVPGLLSYCVYGQTQPTDIAATATGANGQAWTQSQGKDSFSFSRPAGNSSNIPLNGTTTAIGTATFSGDVFPDSQDIVLHINDPAQCRALYQDNSDSCFVRPKPSGPVCDRGATNVAYNAMPFGVVDCKNPALGFEANGVSEFGDEVTLAGTARTLSQLQVLFGSFACQSGHWNTSDSPCVTTPGATFTLSITANIYAVTTSRGRSVRGNLLATSPVTQTIPYRPSADPVNCSDGLRWFNPNGVVGDQCQNNIGVVLTFPFQAGTTLPSQVIWTVAFNTSTAGYNPFGTGTTCFTGPGGCPYDSLNVGTKTYVGAPYAGTDVDPNGAFLNSSVADAYCDGGAGGTGTLRLDTATTGCWALFKPLGRIITTP